MSESSVRPIEFSVALAPDGATLEYLVARIPPDWKHQGLALCGPDRPYTYVLPGAAHFDGAIAEARRRGAEVDAPDERVLALLRSGLPSAREPSGDAPVDWTSVGTPMARTGLMPHQRKAVDAIASRFGGRALLLFDTGTGKSPTSCVTAAHYGGPTLVICVAAAAETWSEEFDTWTDFPDPVILSGGKDPLPPDDGAPCVVIASYTTVRMREDLRERRWTTVIVDECHRVGGKCDTSEAVVDLCTRSRCVLALSATLMQNRPAELFNCLRCVFPRVFTNRRAYEKRYCDGKIGRFGYEARGAKHTHELYALRELWSLTCEKTKVLASLPPLSERDEHVTVDEACVADLEESKRKRAELETRMRAESDPVRAKALKLKFDAEGMRMYVRTGEGKAPACAAWLLDALARRDPTDKYLFFAVHRSMLSAVAEALAAAGHAYALVDGDVPRRKRHAMLRAMRDPTDLTTRVALLSLGTSATSINLACANVVVMGELSFKPCDNEQARDRAWRMGQKRPVEVVRLIAPRTHDDMMLRMHAPKLRVTEEIFGKRAKPTYNIEE